MPVTMHWVGCWSLVSTFAAFNVCCWGGPRSVRATVISWGFHIFQWRRYVELSTCRKIIKKKWWDINTQQATWYLEVFCFNRSSAVCVFVCAYHQWVVFDQTSSLCVAVSGLSAWVKSSMIRNLKMSSEFAVRVVFSHLQSSWKIAGERSRWMVEYCIPLQHV